MATYEDFDRTLLAEEEARGGGARDAVRKRLFRIAAAAVTVTAVASMCAVLVAVGSNAGGGGARPVLRAGEDLPVFDEDGRYILRNYDTAKPMSNFLAGVAGVWGVPLWAFTVNRGQAIASFGVTNKDGSIYKFSSADQAYAVTPLSGFRTFLKGSRDGGRTKFQTEPFATRAASPERDMFIGPNELEIREVDEENGVETSVLYFTVTNEDYPGLIRRASFTNTGDSDLELEVVDGLAKLEPFGVTLGQINGMGRTLEGWMKVYNLEEGMTRPFFHLVIEPSDTADVAEIKAGHFAIAFVEGMGSVDDLTRKHSKLPFICDQQVIFGSDTTLAVPRVYFGSDERPGGASLDELLRMPQSTTSRTPSAFAATKLVLRPGDSATVTTIYGHAPSVEVLNTEIAPRVSRLGYVTSQRDEARTVTELIVSRVGMSSNAPLLDNYIRQNFLDNGLRGGVPFLLGGLHGSKPKVYHAFSRIHGDLERDYNNFVLDMSFFSQGPGNFRDVSQNRRCDVLQEPSVEDFNVRQFTTYIQADGYNQLTVATAFFIIRDPILVHNIASRLVAPGFGQDILVSILSKPWRPGQLFNDIKGAGITLKLPKEELLAIATTAAEQVPAGQYAGKQGGFWADHNGYTLDLYNNYLAVFPDRKEWLLYDSRPVPFFFSLGRVLPREEKHMLASNEGNVRQYDAVVEDERKLDALKMMWGEPGYVGDKYAGAQWQRDEDGKVFTVPLITKLVTLVVNKFAILDPEGMGVEMEAGKPGWNDAMNGLPGLFGSETPTACELRQLLDFVGSAIDEFGRAVPLPVELHTFIGDVYEALDKLSKGDLDDFGYWDAAHTALETYREATAVTFKGDMVSWDAKDLGKAKGALGAMLKRSEEGLRKALAYAPDENRTIIPTYFRYEVTDYELLGFSAARKLPTVRVHSFEASALPLFLEGPTRHLKTMRDQGVDASRKVYEAVRRSTLHDKALQMYKISENLDGQPFEIGRMMAFDSGWLENESVWMHMSYKWYLELLRAGLYDEFFKEIQTGLASFMDPSVFGRSPLEAASFIVSSAFPDKKLHGTGFLARLSGTTAEFLSMWNIMMAGEAPFQQNPEVKDKYGLELKLQPVIPEWMWREDGSLEFKFLGHITVRYICESKANTWGPGAPVVTRYEFYSSRGTGEAEVVDGDTAKYPHAVHVRDRRFDHINVYLDQVPDTTN